MLDKNKFGALWASATIFFTRIQSGVGQNFKFAHLRSQLCAETPLKKDSSDMEVLEYALRDWEYISEAAFADLLDRHRWVFELIATPGCGARASPEELKEVQEIKKKDAAKVEEAERKAREKLESEKRLATKIEGVDRRLEEGTTRIIGTVEAGTRLVAGLVVASGFPGAAASSSSSSGYTATTTSAAAAAASMTIVVRDGMTEGIFRVMDVDKMNRIMQMLNDEDALFSNLGQMLE